MNPPDIHSHLANGFVPPSRDGGDFSDRIAAQFRRRLRPESMVVRAVYSAVHAAFWLAVAVLTKFVHINVPIPTHGWR